MHAPRPAPLSLLHCLRHVVSLDIGASLRGWLPEWRLLAPGVLLTAMLCYGYRERWPLINGNLEWHWRYRRQLYWSQFLGDWMLWLVGAVAIGTLLWTIIRHLPPRPARRIAVAALLVWGFVIQIVAQSCVANENTARLGVGMLKPAVTGFMNLALHESFDRSQLATIVRDYPAWTTLASHHVQTHPPGNVVIASVILDWMHDSPRARAAARQLLRLLGTDLDWPWMPDEATPPVFAAAMLNALLLVALGVLAGLPLFDLARRSAGLRTAWTALLLWVHYPPLIFFAPSYDQAYAGIVWFATWFWVRALRSRTWLHAPMAGLILAAGVFLSFKLLLWPALLTLVLVLDIVRSAGDWHPVRLLRWLRAHPRRARRYFLLPLGAAAAFVLFYVALWTIWRVNILTIIHTAQANQREMLHTMGRHYLTWLFAGPLDVAMLGGPLLALVVAAGWMMLWRRLFATSQIIPAAVLPALAIVTLSGLVLGENARILLMFGPGIAWAGAAWIARPRPHGFAWSLALMFLVHCFFMAIGVNSLVFID